MAAVVVESEVSIDATSLTAFFSPDSYKRCIITDNLGGGGGGGGEKEGLCALPLCPWLHWKQLLQPLPFSSLWLWPWQSQRGQL